VPDLGIKLYISDFDFSCIGSLIKNSCLPIEDIEYGVTDAFNPYYDISYFLYYIFIVCDMSKKLITPILKGPLNGWSNNTCRPLSNRMYKTPIELLNDNIFDCYKCNYDDNNSIIETYNTNTEFIIDNSSFLSKLNIPLTGVIMIPKKSKNIIHDVCLLSLKPLKNFKMPKFPSKMEKEFMDRFEGVMLVNNYTNDNVDWNILYKLAEYIWDHITQEYIIFEFNLENIIKALINKIHIHFCLYPILANIHTTIWEYLSVPLDIEIVKEFFAKITTSSL
jgi:hypothetical protein